MKTFSTVMLFLFGCTAWAQQTLRVIRSNAPVYSTPTPTAPIVSTFTEGRKLTTTGRTENGFILLKTKSGRALWVRSADVEYESVENDLEEPRAPRSDYPHFTYDLGASSGSVNQINYTEINVGLNTFFKDWLAWRNAAFYRFQSGQESVYGLDTSVRGILGLGKNNFGLTLFAGPGFRIVNRGANAPFAEGGAVFHVVGFSLGLGAKTIFNSASNSANQNDTQVFLILAGGGSF